MLSVSPNHSRLYSLEPINKNHPLIEGVNSYVIRLSECHCVTTKDLFLHEILPVLGKYTSTSVVPYQNPSQEFHNLQGITLNGYIWINALEKLTCRNDLRFTTLLPWSNIFVRPQIIRDVRAWCPLCYQEWQELGTTIYEPLLWSINAVSVCPYHCKQLRQRCPKCHRSTLTFAFRAHPGHCSFCGHWLGAIQEYGCEVIVNSLESELRMTRAIGSILAVGPKMITIPEREIIMKNLLEWMVLETDHSFESLASHLGTHKRVIETIFQGRININLNIFMEICFLLDVEPIDVLTRQ